MINAEEAIEKAWEIAKKANLPTLFVTVERVTKKDRTWEILMVYNDKKYLVRIDSETGECLEWSLSSE